MASLARGDQFAGVSRQIGKGRRCGHALPADQPMPPWSSLPLVCQQLDLFALLPDRRRLLLDHPHQPFPFLAFPIQFGA
jgi:hypothetical protein